MQMHPRSMARDNRLGAEIAACNLSISWPQLFLQALATAWT